jgi:signal transduction histidine kinase
MNEKIKILHLEDSLKDSELIIAMIESGGIIHDYFLADNEKNYLRILEKENIDLILSDFSLPDYNGHEALKVAREKYSHIPFIFISGTIGEDAAISAMLNGASDYVLKNKLERLVPAIKRALHEHELENNRKLAEDMLQQAYDNLEIQVKERTAELAEANMKLQTESDEKQKVIEKEKELNLLKSRFISVISHEFRTPLTGIKSTVQLIEQHGDKWDVEKKQKFFNSIYNSIRFTNLLLDDVSIIGRDDSGRTSYNPSFCQIEDVCQQALDDIKQVFGKSDLINYLIKPETIKTFADESLLRHILNNLLSNALKYSGNEKQIDFSVFIEKDKIVFTINDHGIGIPENDLKYIFEPFHRAANVESIKGTGLGLAIVKRCVEMHEGTIEIISMMNKGTTVVVKIPYKKPEIKNTESSQVSLPANKIGENKNA